MKSGLALCIVVFMAVSGALAQPASKDPAVAASSAATQRIAPSHLAAAREMLIAIDVNSLMNGVTQVTLQAMLERLRATHPDMSADTIATFKSVYLEESAAYNDRMLDVFSTIYAQHFTEDELHQLTAFYRSDVGRKALREAPKMVGEVMPFALEMGEQIAAHVRDRINQMRQGQGDTL